MLKPGFILSLQLVAIYNNFHCTKICLTSSTTWSRHFCYYFDKSAFFEETPEEMASKHNKKTKLSDSESASSSSSSGSGSESSSPPRKDAKTKSKSESDSKSKTSSVDSSKSKAKSVRVAGEKEPTWELGGKKFVTIGDFKGKTYVNIREYYEKDGKVLPGKKGISLNLEQWQNFCSSIDEVNEVVKK